MAEELLYVNLFERDLNISNRQKRSEFYDKQATVEYTYDGTSEDLLNDRESLINFINHHKQKQLPRLEMLNDYYEGLTDNVTTIDTRRREKHLADNRVAHDYAAYISDFINGYFLGVPIKYDSKDDELNEFVNELNNINDIDSINRQIGLDLSIFGRAYDIVLRNQKDENRVYRLDPRKVFVVYDNTIEHNSLLAVRYWETSNLFEDEQNIHYNIDIITDSHTHRFVTSELTSGSIRKRAESEPHAFNKVTVTEYKNNQHRRGDFEKVIGLINMMDNIQADTANYFSDINDALLVVEGNVDLGNVDTVRMQKEANLLLLEPPLYESSDGVTKEGRVNTKYIYKQRDVSGDEANKTRINEAIHVFTATPNLSDEHFSGVQSGEAMKYKLINLEQRTVNKEGLFKKGLKRRYSLIENISKVNKELNSSKTLKDMSFIFTRNLPKSLSEEMDMFLKAGGDISNLSLMKLVSFIQNPDEEKKRIEEEKIEQLRITDQQDYPQLK